VYTVYIIIYLCICFSGILCTAMVYNLSYATQCAAYSYRYNTYLQYILQLHFTMHLGYRTSPLQGVSHWDILKMDILPRRLSNYYIITIIFAPVVVIFADTMVKLLPVTSRTLVLVYGCSEGQTIPTADQSLDIVCIIIL